MTLTRAHTNLEGDPVPPKLFLAPAKDGGAPPDACGAGGAAAPSEASPSTRHCVVVLCDLLMNYN